ncbi:TPA: glycosyltransferase [Candidatus Bathyarchaeota archaeon]|nr:glycosyltransferase [Candidatus Bathyarchaeota archaeon]
MVPSPRVVLAAVSALSLLGAPYALDVWILTLTSLFCGEKKPKPKPKIEDWPKVSIVLPFYNEGRVAARILKACLELDYPKDKLEIVVVDDSNDGTTEIAKGFERRNPGLVKLIHRGSREGFKAGALQRALEASTGELIALFDADYVPPRGFLKKLVPHLLFNDNVAFVQSKWGYLNQETSWVTRGMSVGIDFYDMIHQRGRAKLGLIPHFSGTGGIFKKKCLEEVGGWQTDTLAEDLDLSIRLHLAGKRYVYVPEVVCPGEIPPNFLDLMRQQARWAKGFMQCLRKHARSIMKNGRLSLLKKVEALIYLSSYLTCPLAILGLIVGLIFSKVFPPTFVLENLFRNVALTFNFSMGMLIYSAPLAAMTLTISTYRSPKVKFKKARYALNLITIFSLLLVSNSVAAIQGLLKGKFKFHRTPKFGIIKG